MCSRATARPSAAFSWSWLGFTHFTGVAGFAAGALVAAFYFWGWDVSSNLAEETKDGRRNAGLGGILWLLVVLALFEIFTIAAAMSLPPGRVSSNAANVLALLGQQVWPGFGGRLLTLAVMPSTVGTLKTSLIQVTRTLFAMARDRTLPFLDRIHPRREAPCLAAIVAGAIALCLFAFSGFVGSVGDILAGTINAIGDLACQGRETTVRSPWGDLLVFLPGAGA